MRDSVGVGLIGCGAISGEYLRNAKTFPQLRIVACADLNRQAAEDRAREFGVPRVCTVDELLDDRNVELVLNLTTPSAHAPLAMKALAAGKHTYLEKPLGATRSQGLEVMKLAAEKNLVIGCAPDTFLGSGQQTARSAIDRGLIGRPVAFTALMMIPGHESWHPSPEFYYEPGGGPLLDMGPYYLTALMNLLGGVKRVGGMASIAIPQRTITSKPKSGKIIDVHIQDHVVGVMEFECGAVGSIIQSFATFHPPYAATPIVIYGTEGTLQVPDPNHFDGKVSVRGKDQSDWKELPPTSAHKYGRGVGIAELVDAVLNGRTPRASGRQAMAVLDLMDGILESSASGKFGAPTIEYDRPEPMPNRSEYGVFS
jgi:predicted dehydrogenase